MSSGAALDRGGKALRADHLNNVARRDVLLGAQDIPQEHLLGHVGDKGHLRDLARNIHGDVVGRLLQQGNQPLDFPRRLLISLLRAALPVQHGVDQDGDGLGHAVKNQQLVGDEKIHDRRAQVVARRARDDRFDVVYKFIADKADRAAGKTGQAGPGNRAESAASLARPRPGRPGPAGRHGRRS